jgi:hypothetical protein
MPVRKFHFPFLEQTSAAAPTMLENANFVALAFWHSRVLLLRAKPTDRGETAGIC